MNKVQFGIVAVAGVAGVALLIVIGAYFQAGPREKDDALAAQTDRIAQLQAENERLSNLIVQAQSSAPQPSEPSRDLLRLRAEVGVLRQQTNELDGLRKENNRLSQAVAESGTNQVSAQDQLIVRQTHAVDAMVALLQAIQTYATNHSGQFPVTLDQLAAAGGFKDQRLAGDVGPSDFEFGQGLGGKNIILRLRVPIAKPGGGSVVIVGGISDFGQPFTSSWNVDR